MAGFGSVATCDEVFAGLGQTEEGHRVGEAGGYDAGQRFETFQGEALKVRDFFVARVGGGREDHGACDETVGLPTISAVVQFVESAHEQGGAREQLYDQLLAYDPSPVVALNRAVAVAEVDGPGTALALVDALDLGTYHLFHAIRADLLRRLGRDVEARAAYETAIKLTDNTAERDFMRRRRQSLAG
jgi:predicted RNA polymerase sigma factor